MVPTLADNDCRTLASIVATIARLWLPGVVSRTPVRTQRKVPRDIVRSLRLLAAGGQQASSAATSSDPAATLQIDWPDIQSALGGDGDAFGRLVSRYQSDVARLLWRFTRQRSIHEELVQDAFVEAYLSLGHFAGRAPLVHWLRKIAVRVGYRYWERAERERRWETLSTTDIAAGPTADTDAAEELQLLLAKLPPADRLVMTLLYWEEIPISDTAELVGCSPETLRVRAFRARQQLKQLWEVRNP